MVTKIDLSPELLADTERLEQQKQVDAGGKHVKCLPGVTLTKPWRTSEVAIARHLVQRIDQAYNVVSTEGHLWLYKPDKGIWEPISQRKLCGIAQLYDGMKSAGKKGKVINLSTAKTKGIAEAVLKDVEVEDVNFFADASIGVQVANGFIELSDEEISLVPSSADHRTKHVLDCRYDADISTDRWEEFLTRLFGTLSDGEAVANQVQDFIGACLFGLAPSYAKACVFTGEGANGKSTFMDLLSMLFPRSAVTAIVPQVWTREYYLADLRDSLFNVPNEMPMGEITGADIFKAVVTGESVTARFPTEKPFKFKPRAGHLFACNALPATVDHSGGFWRRFLVIPFEADFTKATQTKEEVVQEFSSQLPAILKWAIEGAKRLLQRGRYAETASAQRTLDNWRLESNPVAYWAKSAKLVSSEKQSATVQYLYRVYDDWSCTYGYRSVSLTTFGRRLTELGYRKHRHTDGVRYFCFFERLPPS